MVIEIIEGIEPDKIYNLEFTGEEIKQIAEFMLIAVGLFRVWASGAKEDSGRALIIVTTASSEFKLRYVLLKLAG